MAERDLNIKDVVRMVMTNLNNPGPTAQSSSDSVPVSTTTEVELNSSFQVPRGPQHDNSSNACTPSSRCNLSTLSRLMMEKNNDGRPNTAPIGRDRKNMTFKALLLRVRLSKITLSVRK